MLTRSHFVRCWLCHQTFFNELSQCPTCYFKEKSWIIDTKTTVEGDFYGKKIRLGYADRYLFKYLERFFPQNKGWLPVTYYPVLLVLHDRSRLVLHVDENDQLSLTWWQCVCGDIKYTITGIPENWQLSN